MVTQEKFNQNSLCRDHLKDNRQQEKKNHGEAGTMSSNTIHKTHSTMEVDSILPSKHFRIGFVFFFSSNGIFLQYKDQKACKSIAEHYFTTTELNQRNASVM